MKTIGLLGGMSWESTVTYYCEINRGVQQALGGLSSARIILSSVDFAEVAELQRAGRWAELGDMLAGQARRLERSGADYVFICTNTMHVVYDVVAGAIDVPLVHIADATADAILARGYSTIGLLGTSYTMEKPFYRERLEARGITVLTPGERQRARMQQIIFEELCQGRQLEASRQEVLGMMRGLSDHGAQGVILGCTEIGLLVNEACAGMPIFDTALIHARKAVELALS